MFGKIILVVALVSLSAVAGCGNDTRPKQYDYKYTIWLGNGGYYSNSYKIEDRQIIFITASGKTKISTSWTIDVN